MLPVLFQVGVGFGGFQSMLQNMVSLGFFQFLFPFLLALAIFYGILMWATKDNTGKQRIPGSAIGLISLIMAFFVMLFTSANPGIVQFFQNISGTGLMVGTGLLFVIILLGLTGFRISDLIGENKSTGEKLLLLLIAVIVIVLFFGAGVPFIVPSIYIGSDFQTIIFFIVVLALVLWYMGKEKKERPTPGKPS